MKLFQIITSLLVFFAAFLLSRPAPVGPDSPDQTDRTNALSRIRAELSASLAQPTDDWFLAQRAYPRTGLPKDVSGKMRRSTRAFQKKQSGATPMSVPAWSSIGPTNIGGRVNSILIHPTDPDIIYAAAASGGVWKTTNFGTNWTNIFNESFSIGALAFDPTNPSIVYVGTGEANPSSVDTYPGNGVWKSTDAGVSWASIGLAETGHIGEIAINPLNPSTMYVAALGLYRSKNLDKGVYKSTDAGSSWTQVLQIDSTTGAIEVEIDPSDTSRILAATFTYYRTLPSVERGGIGSGLHISNNAGGSWTQITSGFPFNDADIGRISFDYSQSDPSTVYAMVADGGGYNWDGVYKSLDNGHSWTKTFDNAGTYSEFQVWYNCILKVHPTDPNRVWAGMTSLYSTSDGVNFGPAPYSGDYHVDHHAIAYAPSDTGIVVFGNDGGVFTSTDGGSTWVKCLDLPITQFYAGTVAAQNPGHVLGGSQDNSTVRTHTGITDDWDIIAGGDGFNCLVDPTDSLYVYAEYQNGGLLYSTNGGASFKNGTSGINGSDPVNWQAPIAMDPQHPKTLYTGTNAVYRTKNNMQSWTKISPTLSYGLPGFYSTLFTIDVSRTDSNVIYAGTGDGRVWVTIDGGSSWDSVDTGLPLRWVSRVTVDPDSANIAYVTLSGFREYDNQGHIYRTTNFGASWTDIGTSLPDIPLNDVLVDPLYPNTLYVASDLNVMVTTDLGTTWTELGTGLPGVTVHDIAIHEGTRMLAAFTHGRSIYTISLPVMSPASVQMEVHPRWNLLSTPLEMADNSVSTNFPDATSAVYGYSGGSYVSGDSLFPGTGYWLKFPDVPVSPRSLGGTAITSKTVTVEEGWNIIGSISAGIAVDSITSNPPGMVTSAFYGYLGGYTVSDSILPGRAYWVKVTSAGTLTLSDGPGAAPSNRILIRDGGELPPIPPEFGISSGAGQIPSGFALSQNYPNPFNPVTRISYILPGEGRITLVVYNLTGQVVATLADEIQGGGAHELTFDATGLPSGIYTYRLTAGEASASRKMVVMK